jgi:hypothetical protein
MSDVNMGKIKALYADMVSIEQNVSAIEKRVNGNLGVLARRAAQRPSEKAQPKSRDLLASLKSIVMVASIAFGAGFSLKPGSNISLVFAGIPMGMGVLWIILNHLEKERGGDTVGAEIRQSPGPETKQLWTEDEFHRVAGRTRLSNRTLEACWDVLINGDEARTVAMKRRIYPAQLIRGLREFNEQKQWRGDGWNTQ